MAYKRAMAPKRILIVCLVMVGLGCGAWADDFAWSWRSQETIGKADASVGTTSRLNETDRGALLNVLIARLQKTMSDQGYDADRIREIASTTRIRFVDLAGDDKPLIFAASITLEGGCDAQGNCPMWIFRRTGDGYAPLLDTAGASYTIQPHRTNGLSDLVIMRQISPSESNLTLYRYGDSQYNAEGCYTATWARQEDSADQQPDIAPCKAEPAK